MRLADEPVILLEDPRAVGKSTALQTLAAELNGELLDLDDPATRDADRSGPVTMIASGGLNCIDEYPRAPVVLDGIKAGLNRSTRPGQFLGRSAPRPGAAA